MVKNLFTFFVTPDNAMFTKNLKVLTKIGLREVKHFLDIRDGKRLVAKQVNDLQTFGVGQSFEKVGMEAEDLLIHIIYIDSRSGRE